MSWLKKKNPRALFTLRRFSYSTPQYSGRRKPWKIALNSEQAITLWRMSVLYARIRREDPGTCPIAFKLVQAVKRVLYLRLKSSGMK